MKGYTTEDVARLIGLSAARVRGFARDGFLTPGRGARGELLFSFQDLVILRTAKGLVAARIPTRRIRTALRRLREQLPRGRSLAELRITAEGDRIVVQDGSEAWNPESEQIQLDFAVADLASRARPLARRAAAVARRAEQTLGAEDWYELGLELEAVDPVEARDAYRRALELDAHHADAHVNLGRLLQEGGLVAEAERHYRQALRDEPDHATAAFDLGIVLGRPGPARRRDRGLPARPARRPAQCGRALQYRAPVRGRRQAGRRVAALLDLSPAERRRMTDMRVRVGTSGYAYKEWKGTFYPEKLPADGFLAYYAGKFPAVEINNTFYRMPTEKLLLQWADQVADGFTFVLKLSQKITHFKRLKDVGDEVSYFVRTATALGDKLGPTLVQLPPNMKKDTQRLVDFLGLFPSRWKAAVEFRHASWLAEDVYDALRARDAALCVADTDEDEGDAKRSPAIVATASWGYLRLRREKYDARLLKQWAALVGEQAWGDAYVFFKHEDAGAGPKLAAKFQALF